MKHHVLCIECSPTPDHYVCGTPRDQDEAIAVVDAVAPPAERCVVCFASSVAVCNTCGNPLKVAV